MKILFLTENFPPETNAAATRVFERARYWVKWGHAVTVITCAPDFPRRSLAAAPRHSREHQARLTIEVLELAAAGRGDEAGRTVGP